VGEETVSALIGLHHKTKLHFIEADNVPSNSENANDNQKKKQILSRVRQVAQSKKQEAKSKNNFQDEAQ
jgi:hypothetical protein